MRKIYPGIVLALALIFSAAVYTRLPARIPVHWNWSGQVDRWGGRLEGAFLLPVIGLALWGVFRLLPRIDPRRANYARFQNTYDLFVNALMTALVAFHVMVLGKALGWPISMERVVSVMAGLLMITGGNVLPRARSNWWFGVRTPWTLSSEQVWSRTHRLAGYLFTAAGLIWLVAAVFPGWTSRRLAMAALVTAGVWPIVYSYWAWRKERVER
jgi:immunity protein, SdpI family